MIALLSCCGFAGAASFILSPSHTVQAAVDSLDEMFLKAETEPNRETRIGLWRTLLARPDVIEGKTGNATITASRIKAAIIEDYLQLYKDEKDVDHLEKAKEFIRTGYSQPADKAGVAS